MKDKPKPSNAAVSAPSAPEQFEYGVAPMVHFITLLLAFASLVVSALALMKVNQVSKIVVRQTSGVGDVLKKLTAHPDAKTYFGQPPVLFLQIDQNNFQNLQSHLKGLTFYSLGNYLVQYANVLFLYSYDQDKIIERMEVGPAPSPGPQPAQQVTPSTPTGQAPTTPEKLPPTTPK